MSHRSDSDPLRVFMTGGWGYGNRGDDAILAGTLAGLSLQRQKIEFELVSFSPDETFAQHGIDSAPSVHRLLSWRRPGSLARLIQYRLSGRGIGRLPRALRDQSELMSRADLIVFGGGGYFNEVWDEAFPMRMLELELARDSGTPYLLIGQTLGPFSDRTASCVLPEVLQSAESVGYRDLRSARILELAGVTSDRMFYAADLAHLVGVHRQLAPEGNGPTIGLTFQNHRPYGNPEGVEPFGRHKEPSQYRDAIIETVRQLSHVPGVSFCLIPSTTWDQPFMRKLELAIREFGAPVDFHDAERATSDFISSCQSVDVLLSTNMHPVILAPLAGVPSIALSYNFKLDDYMNRIGQASSCFRLDDFDPSAVADRVKQKIETGFPDRSLEDPISRAIFEAEASLEFISTPGGIRPGHFRI